MICTYTDAIKYLKVGQKVRAVPGKFNPCGELENGNVGIVTNIKPNGVFYVNNCSHVPDANHWIELIDVAPKLEDVRTGDWVLDADLCLHLVVDTSLSGCVKFISSDYLDGEKNPDSSKIDLSEGVDCYTWQEMKENGFTVFLQEEPVAEMTVEEISKALGKTVKVVKSSK